MRPLRIVGIVGASCLLASAAMASSVLGLSIEDQARLSKMVVVGEVMVQKGEIDAADVRLTTQYRWTSGNGGCPCAAGSAIYLNAVSAHEHGHVIGLCHVNQPSSLMYPSFGVCENKSKGSDESAGERALCY